MVYFTTAEPLTTASDQDADTSADLYRADVGATVSTLTRVTTGPGEQGDACEPSGNSFSNQWNVVPGGQADCSAVAVGGGGGVAPDSGAIYFLSPEQLDGTAGAADAPNLYLVAPGQGPEFVATLDSSLDGPQPPVVTYPPGGQSFGSFTRSTGIAVDDTAGAVYVLDLGFGAGSVKKFDAAGSPVNFTAGSGAGTNVLSGAEAPTGAFGVDFFGGLAAQIAVDRSSGRLYVPDYGHDVVDVFASTGAYLSQIAVPDPSGVAIDPVTHDVFVTSRSANTVSVFTPAGAPVTSFSVIAAPLSVAVDSTGRAYVADGSRVASYDEAGDFIEIFEDKASFGVAVNPDSDNVLVNRGDSLVHLTPQGELVDDPIGGLSNSVGVAIGAGHAYVSAGTKVTAFRQVFKPDPLIDNPLVVNALSDADSRRKGDFQLTPSGGQAVFPSRKTLTGSGVSGSKELFRFDSSLGLECVSCSPTGGKSAGDATLTPYGSSITDDGRVFFTTSEPLVLRDSNEKKDAYEWSAGVQQLISSGTDPHDSSLLSVGSDGTDAFFFTREKLVQEDENGVNMRLYDARTGGGFAHGPPTFECAASDECHGPSSRAPSPANVATLAGTPGNHTVGSNGSKRCPKGKRRVKRRGKERCVKAKRQRRRHQGGKTRNSRKGDKARGANAGRGGSR